jgi:hypothetical protein
VRTLAVDGVAQSSEFKHLIQGAVAHFTAKIPARILLSLIRGRRRRVDTITADDETQPANKNTPHVSCGVL